MFTLGEIAKATKGKLINADTKAVVKGVSTDSRTILTGELFIALKGERFDGHRFLKDAFAKGAPAAVVSADNISISKRPIIRVNDTETALGDIGSAYRRKLKIPMVGITGSNGKTTVKDMIAWILSKRYKVAKTHETENNLIGVPLTLLRIKDESFAVVEMGTNAPGEINYLAQIVKPYVGLIINIGPSHLEGLKTLKDILKEKSKLFGHLEKKGCAVINKDDPLLSSLKIKSRTLTFGITAKNCDYYADKITNQNAGTQFILNNKYKFSLPVLGMHNVYNALAAVSACSALGIDIKVCQEALLDFRPAKMRFNISKHNGIDIINDAYNSNPLSMKVALDTFSSLKTKGSKIVVAADMLELGKDTGILHYETGQLVAKSGVDILITVGNLAAKMAEGARDNGMSNSRVKNFKDYKEAAEFLLGISKPNDTILVKGSRAMKMEEFIECFITSYTR